MKIIFMIILWLAGIGLSAFIAMAIMLAYNGFTSMSTMQTILFFVLLVGLPLLFLYWYFPFIYRLFY